MKSTLSMDSDTCQPKNTYSACHLGNGTACPTPCCSTWPFCSTSVQLLQVLLQHQVVLINVRVTVHTHSWTRCICEVNVEILVRTSLLVLLSKFIIIILYVCLTCSWKAAAVNHSPLVARISICGVMTFPKVLLCRSYYDHIILDPCLYHVHWYLEISSAEF